MPPDPRTVEVDREETPEGSGTLAGPAGCRMLVDRTNVTLIPPPILVGCPWDPCVVLRLLIESLLGSRPDNWAKLSMWVKCHAEARRKSGRSRPSVEWRIPPSSKLTVYRYIRPNVSYFGPQTRQ